MFILCNEKKGFGECSEGTLREMNGVFECACDNSIRVHAFIVFK